MKILVSTDTSCLVKNDCFSNYEISLFPLNVIIDGEEFLDGVSINQQQLKEAMRAGKSIKTSTPPLGDVIDYFEKLLNKGYDHIIHFTISSKLSSMYSLFSNVAEQHFKGKVTVVDSYILSSVMLSYVFYAYEEAQKGVDPSVIVENIEAIKQDNKLLFIPENLTALKNGGRISPTIALIGNVLGIKPVIMFNDGELVKTEMTRKERSFFTNVIEEYSVTYPIDKYDYTIISFDGAERTLNHVRETLEQRYGKGTAFDGILPINVCAHCGPGTVGISISRKINGKSITEFLK